MSNFMDSLAGVGVIITFIWWCLWVAVLSVMIHYDNNPISSNVDLNYIYQVATDWNTSPFVDMTVATDDRCPTSHPDEVIYDLWAGATILCDCIDRDGEAHRDIEC